METDFIKRVRDSEFKFDKIGLRPHIFFGEIEVNQVLYYEYVIFNIDHFDRPFRKSKRVVIKYFDLKDINLDNIDETLIESLKNKIGETNEDKYKSIKRFLGINKVNDERRGNEVNEEENEEENERRKIKKNERRKIEENERRKKAGELIRNDFSKEHYIGEFTIKKIGNQFYFFIGHNKNNYSLVFYYTQNTDNLKKNIESFVVLMLVDGKIQEIENIIYESTLKKIVDTEGMFIENHNRGHVNINPREIKQEYHHLCSILQNFYNNLITYNNGEWFKKNPIMLMKEKFGEDKDKLLEHHRRILAKKIAKRFIIYYVSRIRNSYNDNDFSEILNDENIIEKFGLEHQINMKNGEDISNATHQCQEYLESELKSFFSSSGIGINGIKRKKRINNLEGRTYFNDMIFL